jgi:hypothetical protein
MTTRTIRVDFLDSNNATWTSTYPVANELITSPSTFWTLAQKLLFLTTATALKLHFQPECDSKRGGVCAMCPAPSTKTVMAVASFLQEVSDSYVFVAVVPVCGSDQCKLDAFAKLESLMRGVEEEASG